MVLYLCELTPPRPTFPAQMTPEEGAAMQRHFSYWNDQMKRGAALVFGPVAKESEAKRLCAQDPVNTAKLGFTVGVFQMPNAVTAAR